MARSLRLNSGRLESLSVVAIALWLGVQKISKIRAFHSVVLNGLEGKGMGGQ